MNINSRNLDLFRKDFNKAMTALEAQHGVSINLGRLTYTDSEFRGKVIVTNGAAGPKKRENTSSDFQLGQRVKINHKKVASNRMFKIIKINRKSITVEEIGDGFAQIKVSPNLLERI